MLPICVNTVFIDDSKDNSEHLENKIQSYLIIVQKDI